MKDAKQFWDSSADKYVKSPIKDLATYQKKLAITQEYLSTDSRILEFGCGSGGTAILHAPHVQQILAIDLSDRMIDIARQKAVQAGVENVRFLQGTLAGLEGQGESFDAVLGLNVLHLLDNLDDAIGRVHRLLKKGGVFVSSTSLIGEVNVVFRGVITAMQWLGLAPFVSRFTRNQLVAGLEGAGFRVEREWRTSHESVFIVARKI